MAVITRDIEEIGAFRYDPPKGLIVPKYIDGRDNDDFPEHGITGPYGTAKTTMMMDFMLRRGSQYPGMNTLLVRATLTSLKGSSLVTLERRFGSIFENNMNRNEGIYRFPKMTHPLTGQTVRSQIKAVGLDRVDIEQVLKSTEFGTVVFEEANELSSDVMDLVQFRCRQEIYHATLKVKDLCIDLSQKWGVHPEEVYEILLQDTRHRVGQKQLDWNDPMPGRTVVKMVWNPGYNDDHVWQRFIGLPYPEPEPTEAWVRNNVGVREVHVDPERLRRRHFFFLAGSLVKLPDGSRRYAAKHDEKQHVVRLVPDHADPKAPMFIHEDEAGLIVQRNCTYVFPWENEDRDYQNDENSFLAQNQGLADRAMLGTKDRRAGRVFPLFIDDYAENGGHLLRWPGKELLARRKLPIVGGIDQGGRHATAIFMGVVTPQTNTVILYDEYVRSGVSASESAYDAKEMILPGAPSYTFGYDPQMNAKRYDQDTEYATIVEYQEVLDAANLFPGIRGDAGFELVNKFLMQHDNFLHGMVLPRLLVFDHLTYARKALLQLTWHMVDHSRDNVLVDVGDSIKFMMSVVREVNVQRVPNVEVFKPRLAYNPRRVRRV